MGFIGEMSSMGCCCQGTERREVVLKFLWEELLYDVRNAAYTESDVMKDAGLQRDNTHARHVTADIGEAGNVDRVRRVLSVVHEEVKELLYPFTKEEVEAVEISKKLEEPESYDIAVTVPVTMSKTTMQLLSKLVHEYMVARVLSDWLSSTNTAAAEVWAAKAEEKKTEINNAKNQRREAQTRKISVF